MKTIFDNTNITVNSSYRKLEFVKNGRVAYMLSKDANKNSYSVFNVRTGKIHFFVPYWNRKKLIKAYINVLANNQELENLPFIF